MLRYLRHFKRRHCKIGLEMLKYLQLLQQWRLEIWVVSNFGKGNATCPGPKPASSSEASSLRLRLEDGRGGWGLPEGDAGGAGAEKSGNSSRMLRGLLLALAAEPLSCVRRHMLF
jgi:hypothetical protein